MPLLSQLHTVELQSALQFLPLADLLSFRCCSPATLPLASSPFVFQHVAAVAVTSPKLCDAIRASSSPVLSLVPLSIAWQPDPEVPVWPQLELLINAQLTVRELDASRGTSLDMELWHSILRCPWARRLRVLKLHEAGLQLDGRWDRPTFDLIAGLPLLSRLHMIVKKPVRDLAHWCALAASASLTHATIDDRSYDWIGDQPFNLHAPNLSSLHLISPILLGQNFDVFFAHESMRQLRSLHLQGLRVESVLTGQAHAIAGLQQLINLEEITLTEVLCSGWLLDEFHRLPLLRLVTMQLHARSYSDTSFISEEHFVEMLRRSPQLHCALIPSTWNVAKVFRPRWESLLHSASFAEFGARMRIQSIPNNA